MVFVVYSDQFLEHLTGSFHPECPPRLTAVVARLRKMTAADRLTWLAPTPLEVRSPLVRLRQVHQAEYIEAVAALCRKGGGRLDEDTPVSAQSFDVACLAVNAWIDGVDHVLQTGQPAFVLARPPGHHALPDRGMGFCVFANAAIAALYALEQPGIERVAILDWDVHHGNGTQAIVAPNPRIAYCSLHQYPCYPGTGKVTETGPHQTILNLPLPPGSTLLEYERQFQEQVLPFLQRFKPDLLVVSAGFDANRDDPLAEVQLQPSDYGQFTHHCLTLTPRILFGLEGGYDLPSLSASVEAVVSACLRR